MWGTTLKCLNCIPPQRYIRLYLYLEEDGAVGDDLGRPQVLVVHIPVHKDKHTIGQVTLSTEVNGVRGNAQGKTHTTLGHAVQHDESE
jgi:hypothetical protein